MALPKLQNLTLNLHYDLEIPPLFNITINYVSNSGNIKKKLCGNYKKYGINKWKNIFYKSINIK